MIIMAFIAAAVSAGTPLLRADLSAIRSAGYPVVTPVIVMNDKDARVELV